jgi:hypothetical protein
VHLYHYSRHSFGQSRQRPYASGPEERPTCQLKVWQSALRKRNGCLKRTSRHPLPFHDSRSPYLQLSDLLLYRRGTYSGLPLALDTSISSGIPVVSGTWTLDSVICPWAMIYRRLRYHTTSPKTTNKARADPHDLLQKQAEISFCCSE